MLHMFNVPMATRVKHKVKHQHIGGKKILIEGWTTIGDIIDCPVSQLNIAQINFIQRRIDLIADDFSDSVIVYYGHVKGLGYLVAEDEIRCNKIFKTIIEKGGE